MAKLNKKDTRFVNVVNGAGNDAVPYVYTEGDTVASMLAKAGITLHEGDAVTLGRKNIQDPENTPVKGGDTLVIATKVSNG